MKKASYFHENGCLAILTTLLIITLMVSISEASEKGAADKEGESKSTAGIYTTNSKPWSYWWWLGSAVDEKNIEYNLKKFQEAGLGGVHIIPIYGVIGQEANDLDYLSPEWVEMLQYTSKKCEELGLGLDMTLGTGWCFGGPKVDENSGSMKGQIQKTIVDGGEINLDLSEESKYDYNSVQSVMAVLPDGSRLDITANVNSDQQLIWKAPSTSSITLYVMRMEGPVFKVKRPAPGGEGYMLDPFSPTAINKYTDGFDEVFHGNLRHYLRSIYHDSYEYQADWTPDLFDQFKSRRGYDLRVFLPELTGEASDTATRVTADYRQTLSELHEAYIQTTKDWAGENGLLFRNQSHGSPANWLDLYGIADIPETETFGATPYKIPGLTREPEFINNDQPNRFVLKFASSAAHVMGKPLVSSETNTWLREHFRVALSHSKPELDQLFLSGINHIFYHGIAYSPKEADWPGWQFYASTNYGPTNSTFFHQYGQNEYIARCQEALRSGQPDNDILLYYPIQDIWHTSPSKNKLYKLTAHNYKDWFIPFPIQKTAKELDNLGYSFDYISDKQLLQSVVENNMLQTKGNKYKTLIIPKTEFMPIATLQAIQQLAANGARVIFLDDLPRSVPGYYQYEQRATELKKIENEITKLPSDNFKLVKSTASMDATLLNWQIKKEHFNTHGLPYIRRKTDDGYVNFISNIYGGKDVDAYVLLSVEAKDVVFTDPMSGESGRAILQERKGVKSMLLQIEQGQSLIIQTLDESSKEQSLWPYIKSTEAPMEITGNWKIEFVDGGPKLPNAIETHELKSWTALGNKDAEGFAGVARYSIDFDMKEPNADDYILDFEKVKESAVIQINGHELPVLFAHPFKILIGKYLNPGTNILEIEVANLSANRIRDLDQQGVKWQKFHDINFVDINYKHFDASNWELMESGLIGKVNLVPVKFIQEVQ